MADQLDLDNRDPKTIYDEKTFQVAWEEVFAEPDPGVHSLSGVWKCSFRTFSCVRLWSYRLLSICGIFASCCFGCEYGATSCCLIWCCTPFLKLCQLKLIPVKQCLEICLDTCYRPCIDLLSYLFWNIRVTIRKDDGSQNV